jgi:putative Holliday junction resolvase
MACIIALDVGDVRVGVARAHPVARIAEPLATLLRQDHFWRSLAELLEAQEAELVVVGLPRNLDGDDTAQTARVREFAKDLAQHTTLPQVFQDEALTSHKAETELQATKKSYQKSDIDALAATYILADYLMTQGNQ